MISLIMTDATIEAKCVVDCIFPSTYSAAFGANDTSLVPYDTIGDPPSTICAVAVPVVAVTESTV